MPSTMATMSLFAPAFAHEDEATSGHPSRSFADRGNASIPPPLRTEIDGGTEENSQDDQSDTSLNAALPNRQQLASTDDMESLVSNGLDAHSKALGWLRCKGDMRQIGGVLFVLGIGACFSSLALTSVLVYGMGGSEQVDGFRLPLLTAAVIQAFLGFVAMVMGFITLVLTPTTRCFHKMAKWLVAIVNLGPISFVITVVRLAQGASDPPEDNEFIPSELEPTQQDIRFVAAMGILALFSVCSTLIGGLTIISLNLCAYLGNQPIDKNQGYYIVRYAYYNLLVLLGGFSQLALGAYLIHHFGSGPYEEPVHVAVYTVFFPPMTVVVGIIQMLSPMYGWCRSVGWVHMGGSDDNSFLYAHFVMVVVTMVLQIVAQPAYAPGDQFDAEGATVACVYMGTFVVLPYLDWLVRNTAMIIDPLYFGLPADTKEREDSISKLFGLTGEQQRRKREAQCERPSDASDGTAQESTMKLSQIF